MNTCDEIQDRLFDEDSRRALVARDVVPGDVARHLARCAACRQAWQAARQEMRLLGRSLAEPAPEGLRLGAVHALSGRFPPPPPPLLDWRSAALWGVAGAALAACGVFLAGPLLPPVWQATAVLGVVGVSLGLELTLQGLEATGA
jgi:hypothetical protein